MPQTPTTYMLLVQPTEGGDDDVWDTLYTALFLLVDGHDHTTGKGKPLGSASLVIDAALNLRDFDAINVGSIEFTPLGALPSSGYVNRFFGYAGDAWWRNSAGTNVQITSGGALNMTTVGGIAGQYTSVSAEVAFVDASDSYTFKQQIGAAVRQYARLEAADLRLYEYRAHPNAVVPTTFVGLASPVALAGSYTLTMPAALPATTRALLVSATGAITDAAITETTQLSHFDLVGFGASVSYTNTAITGGGAALTINVPLRVKVGWSITTVRVRLDDGGGAGFTAPVLRRMQISTRAITNLATATGAAGDAWWTATPASPEVVAADFTYELVGVSGAAGGLGYGAEVTCSRNF